MPIKLVVPPSKKEYDHAGRVKAVEINILLEDGTRLTAKGGHATDSYIYLMDCVLYCATNNTVSYYPGPMLHRLDAEGNSIPQEGTKRRV